ncbi:hypothetical protein [Caudoviricetes sp.]|nr:hypothetical protein [Caudoviricetes sp.]
MDDLPNLTKEAFDALRDALAAPSLDVRRRAAMDVLHIQGLAGGKRAPQIKVSEEDLNVIGRVLCEIKEDRLLIE